MDLHQKINILKSCKNKPVIDLNKRFNHQFFFTNWLL